PKSIKETLLDFDGAPTHVESRLRFSLSARALDRIRENELKKEEERKPLAYYKNQRGQLADVYLEKLGEKVVGSNDYDNFLKTNDLVTALLVRTDAPSFPLDGVDAAPRVLLCSTEKALTAENFVERGTAERTFAAVNIPVVSQSITFS